MKAKVPALILAGSRPGGDPLARHAGVPHKAAIPIAGRPMLTRVAEALAGSDRVGEIAVSIDDPAAAGAAVGLGGLRVLPPATTPSLSVAAAIKTLGTPLLVTTADHVLLLSGWVDHFLEHLPDAGVAVAVARSEIVMAAAAETKRTFLRFRGGAYSGCNLFYFRDASALGAIEMWRRVEMHRKRPLKLLGVLGPIAVARHLLGRLTLEQALAMLGQKAGTRIGVVEMPFGESAIDVDKPDDLDLVERIIERRAASAV
ncbi:nucleotidyltransferase family protein [Manganibacter manganicus]|uniref:MobA-like NTP transferase domain-containing protein n=1 Tax=Manganibacter manganicus TaxID=1873176 RepID=A0A1V8RML8_9HYPH|nr:nucleotidyltransferase family protein [Pseudaminobacter manganicus]OQM74437.1 hypothetical protein BFN67_22030 [Pseudaminobacter manganicus]